MSAHGDDVESIAWPGFVDILSATIMMFMFFVLIIAVALFFHVLNFTGKLDSTTATESIAEVKQQVVELEEENEELREKISGLNQKALEIDAQFSETQGDQRFSVSEDGLTFVIFFGAKSITVNENTATEVKNFVDKAIAAHGGKIRISITSPKSRSNIDTVARKVAIARILNTRNGLLKTELPRDAISFQVVPPSQVENNSDWSMIQIRKGG
jgi:cell division protein FtsB